MITSPRGPLNLPGGEPPDNFVIVARDQSGRFAKGASGNAALRFKKGQCGNPKGRPRGSGRFRSGARAAAALLDAEAEHITEKAVELALGGDAVAVRFCLGRLLGVRRGQPVELALPEIAAPRDLSAAIAAITGAVTAGRITPDEALSLSQMLDGLCRACSPPPAPTCRPSRTTRTIPGKSSSTSSTASPTARRCASRKRWRRSPRSGGTARLIETAGSPPSGS
jgi:hypothetical protein